YYVVAESLTNAAKHGAASAAAVTVSCSGDTVTVEIADTARCGSAHDAAALGDTGRGGGSLEAGSGLRGLVDRVEALGGLLALSSPHGAGTLVRADLALRERSESSPAPPPRIGGGLATMSTEVSWEPVSVLVSAVGGA